MALKILIANGDSHMLTMMEDILRKNGYDDAEFYKAHDGIKAITLLYEVAPDVAIVDMTLPDLSGLDVLRYMKAKYPRMPVIMPAEAEQVIALYECLRSGLDEHIPKPILPERLVDAVRKVTG